MTHRDPSEARTARDVGAGAAGGARAAGAERGGRGVAGGDSLRVVSWNVNGLRAIDRTGHSRRTGRGLRAGRGPTTRRQPGARASREGFFRRWLERTGAFAVGVQEVRARREQLPRRLAAPRGWFAHVVEAERKGYSGVGLYARRTPERVTAGLGDPAIDREGRVQIAEIGRLVVANAYFPNGNGVDRDNSRVPYKLAFYRALFERLQDLRARGRHVLVMGDFNTAHRDIDLARPRQNLGTSGFLPEERAELARWLDAGWVDTFRAFEPGPGHYTWWSQRVGVRERNIGWRLDYVLACPRAARLVRGAFIWSHVWGSDHCPVGVDLAPEIL